MMTEATKVNARRAAHREVPTMEKCAMCGASGVKLNRHHPDYNKPKEVVVLCTKCHAAVHKKPPVAAICVVCGKTFHPKNHRYRAKLCGDENCRREYGRICAEKRWKEEQ